MNSTPRTLVPPRARHADPHNRTERQLQHGLSPITHPHLRQESLKIPYLSNFLVDQPDRTQELDGSCLGRISGWCRGAGGEWVTLTGAARCDNRGETGVGEREFR